MKMNTIFLCFLFSNLLFLEVNTLTCGNNQIENCKECGKGNQSDTCATCEDNHFSLLENLFCFSCDDPIYGQPGCKGACTYKIDKIDELYKKPRKIKDLNVWNVLAKKDID